MTFDFSALDMLIAALAAIAALVFFVGVAWLADRLWPLRGRTGPR